MPDRRARSHVVDRRIPCTLAHVHCTCLTLEVRGRRYLSIVTRRVHSSCSSMSAHGRRRSACPTTYPCRIRRMRRVHR
jgi:hypothetical protein